MLGNWKVQFPLFAHCWFLIHNVPGSGLSKEDEVKILQRLTLGQRSHSVSRV